MKVIIMAGGMGTRIAELFPDVPKPLIKIAGKTVLEHQIDVLKRQGLTDITITVSYMAQKIIDYFGDGKNFGVNIEYFVEDIPLGNAGALFKIKNLNDDFIIINGDLIFDIDFSKLIAFHKEHNALASIVVHPNTHPYDSSLISVDSNSMVINWTNKEEKQKKYYHNCVNSGIHIISPLLLNKKQNAEKIDLDRDLLKPNVGCKKIFAYNTCEYIKDMGTPQRFLTVEKDIINKKVSKKNISNKQKAIFLDRDGTINIERGFLTNINNFKLLPGVIEAIKLINESDYLAILATNQPVIARGDISYKKLDEIHNKMETLLGNEGAYLDYIYFCPHHPDSGFPGEIKELKIVCDCRKPSPGMLLKASKRFNIDLEQSWMIGDRSTDIKCGKNAKCKTALIGKGNYGQDITNSSLLENVKEILNGRN